MKLFANSSGFSMIEAMVAAGLFSVAILGMVTLMERQNVALGGLQTQINLRQILNSAEQAYEANSNNFRPRLLPLRETGRLRSGRSSMSAAFRARDWQRRIRFQTWRSSRWIWDRGKSCGHHDHGSLRLQPSAARGPGRRELPGYCRGSRRPDDHSAGRRSFECGQFLCLLLPPMAAGANPCSPTPSSYGVGAPASPRNWSATNYVSTPTKLLQDSFDVTYPP